jgi:hypothetical protein
VYTNKTTSPMGGRFGRLYKQTSKADLTFDLG